MRRFVEGTAREQTTFISGVPGDWIGKDNPVRVKSIFLSIELDLTTLGFDGVAPEVSRATFRIIPPCC